MLLVALFIFLVIFLLWKCQKEGLNAQPDGAAAKKYADELIEKRYAMANYTIAKKVFPWMDPVAYESVRDVVRTGGYDAAKIASVLRE